MTHGVHAVQHEVDHEIKHGDQQRGHANLLDNINKKVALLIGVMALFLAFSETLGKSAQTGALSYNIEAANLWAFFQAKNVRRTVVLTAAEEMMVNATAASEAVKAAATQQIDTWQKTAARYRSEPEVREGTVELAARAKEMEAKRDTALAKHHHYEMASAAFQIAHRVGISDCDNRHDASDVARAWAGSPWSCVDRDRSVCTSCNSLVLTATAAQCQFPR